MQSPIDLSADFSSDLLDTSIVIREPESRCQDAMTNKMDITRLERKVCIIYIQLQSHSMCIRLVFFLIQLDSIMAQQKKQLRINRDNAIQIAELKTQMTEFRRSFEEAPSPATSSRTIGVIPPIDASTPTKAIAETSASSPNASAHSSSSDSIQVLGISPNSTSDSSSTTTIIGSDLRGDATAGTSSKNIKPRNALKRRMDDKSDSSNVALLSKIMRFEKHSDAADHAQ